MDSKEPNEQQHLQPPHGTLTGSYNRNAAALMGPTSTSQTMHHGLSVGDLSLRQPQQPLGLNGSPSSVATQQPWMQFGNKQRPRGRGRPRKYAPDGRGASAANSSDPPVKRSRGRPPLPSKTQLNASGGAGTPFIPDINIIEVEAGEVVAYTHQGGPREVVILSASGAISSVLLRESNNPSRVVKYEGQYEIVAMSGSFLNTESNGTLTMTGNLTASLADHSGQIVWGFVPGMLVAGSQVQVRVRSLVPERVVENNPEPASASASASAIASGGGGLNDTKSPLHHIGNSTPQSPKQMCDLHLLPQ